MKENLRSWSSIPRALILCCILLISINKSNATNHELREELRVIHQEIGSLKAENHQQNVEIALLKEIAWLQDKPNHQKVNKKQPDDQTINKLSTRTGNDRQKRPYRLLPLRNDYEIDGHDKRKGTTISPKPQFYGPPTGCSDLSLLGFTLNGFYQVKSNASTNIGVNNDTKLDTVFCAFNQPGGTSNPSLVEKRIISRSEITKPSSKIIFHAKLGTDLKLTAYQLSKIPFDKVLLNFGNSFNAITEAVTGTFIVPKSGVYLFIFRGFVIYPKYLDDIDKQFWIYFNKNGIKLEHGAGVTTRNQSCNVELDKLVKGNRGDMIMVESYFFQANAIFSSNATSFSAYLLEE